jgi:hypothetical protein
MAKRGIDAKKTDHGEKVLQASAQKNLRQKRKGMAAKSLSGAGQLRS